MGLCRDEWNPTRRKVWSEARRQKISHDRAEVWHFIHPDDRVPRASHRPPDNYDDVAMKTYGVCSIWLRPIKIYQDGILPLTEAHRVYDGKNDDTFYVSREGDVWVEPQFTASTTPIAQSTIP